MRIQVNPVGNMNLLSPIEVDQLAASAESKLYNLYRNCSLAVLNAGSHTDDAEVIYQQFKDFEIHVLRRERGVKLELVNPPKDAFVDDKIILGIREHLSAVLRDILFTNKRYDELCDSSECDTETTTHIVFDLLRNANAIQPETMANLITCWGWSFHKSHRIRLHQRSRLSTWITRL